MIKIVSFLYGLSVLIFFFVLLYVYAFLPEQVILLSEEGGAFTLHLTKSEMFYVALALFVFTNGIIMLYRNVNKDRLNLYNEDFNDMTFDEQMYHWLNGLSLVFNVIFSFSMLFVSLYNNSQDFDVSNYAVMVYVGPTLLIGWIFWFVYLRFSINSK